MKTTKKTGVLASFVGADNDGSRVSTQRNTTSSRQQYRVMDDLTRKRRLRHDLEKLEKDNFHDDPHANLMPSKKAPRFDDVKSGLSAEDKRRRANVRLRYLSFAQLLDDDSRRKPPNYASASAPPPEVFRLPKRHFCSVCGFKANYTCVTCGMRFCCINCNSIHKETRCLKWTA